MPQQGDQCIFCQLINNPQELNIIAETDNFYVWHEYPEPRAKGQANIVPKEHVNSITELSPEEYSEAMKLVREVMEKAKEGIDAEGVTVVIPEGKMGGQMLDHMYIQVFPRFEEDENAGTPASAVFPQKEMNDQEINETTEKMASIEVDFGKSDPVEPDPESQRFREETGNPVETSEDSKEEPEEVQEEDEKEIDGESFTWD